MDNKWILLDEDHKLITKALEFDPKFKSLSEADQQKVLDRLSAATVVSAYDFPNTVSRLYDTITLREIQTRKNLTLKLVPPEESNENIYRISVLTPLGMRLMGVQKGEGIFWTTGKKRRQYVVLNITNAVYI